MPSAERHVAAEPITNSSGTIPSLPLRVVYPEGLTASPSLQRVINRSERAYEVKFLVCEDQAQEIERRLQSVLAPDPHVDAAAGNSYDVATLYYDTPAWDVFHRRGRYRLLKFRARRYGSSAEMFLERKSRQKDRVLKRRSMVALARFDQLGSVTDLFDANAAWYARQLARHQFQPACLIEYRRVAYFGVGNSSPIRLTFDRRIRGGLTSQWSFAVPPITFPLLADVVVCELKYRGPMPSVFKSLVHDLQLSPQCVSKYRQCVQVSGILPAARQDHA